MRASEPYHYLFSLGGLSALIGTGLWGLYQVQMIGFFPRQAHGNLMFFGFLWFFVAGFLMTAVPKMTGSARASDLEVFTAVGLGLAQVLLSLGAYTNISVWCYAFQNFFLLFFVSRRFYQTKIVPFDGFVFVPFAFCCGILAPLLYATSAAYPPHLLYLFAGEAFVLNLIMGLGGRLIPVISRLPNALMPHEASDKNKLAPKLVLAGLLNLSFLLQLLDFFQIAIFLRLLVCTIVSLIYFRLFTRPSIFTVSGLALKIAVVTMISGYFLLLVGGQKFNLPALHLVYIGGFSLMTIMIASRVMLAHGGKSLDYERKSRILFVVAALILMAGLFRYLAGYDVTSKWLAYSTYAMMIALSVWSFKFVKIWWTIDRS